MDDPVKLVGDDVIKARLDQFESQLVFRTLLDAFARPGSIAEIPATIANRLPSGVIPLLALLGHGSPFAVLGDPDSYWTKVIRHTTGARPTDVAQASYIAIVGAAAMSDYSNISVGTPSRPDYAAHVAIGFSGAIFEPTNNHTVSDAEVEVLLRGPGIAGERHLVIAHPGEALLNLLGARRDSGTLGFDIWILDERGRVIGIPRSCELRHSSRDSSSIGGH